MLLWSLPLVQQHTSWAKAKACQVSSVYAYYWYIQSFFFHSGIGTFRFYKRELSLQLHGMLLFWCNIYAWWNQVIVILIVQSIASCIFCRCYLKDVCTANSYNKLTLPPFSMYLLRDLAIYTLIAPFFASSYIYSCSLRWHTTVRTLAFLTTSICLDTISMM